MLKTKLRQDGRSPFVEKDGEEEACFNGSNESFDNYEEWAQKSATERQVIYCEKLGNRIWNKYPNDDLQKIIAFALFGPPNLETSEEDADLLSGYSKKQKKDTLELFKAITKHVPLNDEIHLSVIYVVCETAKGVRFDVPVFRIRQCVPEYEINIDLGGENVNLLELYMDCCVLFVDIEGRTYKSWQHFLSDVRLPKCKMTVPYKGFYYWNSTGKVILREHMSPECSVGAQVKRVVSHTGSAASATSAVVLVASAIPAITVAPAVVTGALVVGVGAGVTIAATGIMTIVDRIRHRQTVAPTNMESVNAYVSIGGGLLGASQMVFARGLATAAQEGVAIKEGVKTAYNVVNGLSLTVNGVGVASTGYSGVNRWITEKQVSPVEVLQFTTQLLFFTGTVVSLKSANTIIREAQASVSVTQKTKQFFNNTINGEKRGFVENVRELFKVNDNVIQSNPEQDQITSVSPLEVSRLDLSLKDQLFSNLLLRNVNWQSLILRVGDRLIQACTSPAFEQMFVNGITPNTEDIVKLIMMMIRPMNNFIADVIVDIFAYIMQNVRPQPIFCYIDRLYGRSTSVQVVVLEFIKEFLLKTARDMAQSTNNVSVKYLTKAVEMFCVNGSFSDAASRFIVYEFEEYICIKMNAFVIEKEISKGQYVKCKECRMGYHKK